MARASLALSQRRSTHPDSLPMLLAPSLLLPTTRCARCSHPPSLRRSSQMRSATQCACKSPCGQTPSRHHRCRRKHPARSRRLACSRASLTLRARPRPTGCLASQALRTTPHTRRPRRLPSSLLLSVRPLRIARPPRPLLLLQLPPRPLSLLLLRLRRRRARTLRAPKPVSCLHQRLMLPLHRLMGSLMSPQQRQQRPQPQQPLPQPLPSPLLPLRRVRRRQRPQMAHRPSWQRTVLVLVRTSV
mmetsp:Transcript_27553/g.55456  ORF Transcript_27553/g.55456 Transcript_27553/m.55456 type:complete len:244 (+) Transcript_27553:528-1259(+)